MNEISWGIIGCGDVTEVKSGPAFNKVRRSKLHAVMRRNGQKAADYAKRHNVPVWYDDAAALINDPMVNAIYVATPPSSHELYALAAIETGKPVYVEKPMALNHQSALRIQTAAERKQVKVSVAHYRREQPIFKKIKELLDTNQIGEVHFIKMDFSRKLLKPSELEAEKIAWRVDPAMAGGGLFHDLAPHQLDLMIYFFGKPVLSSGTSLRSNNLYYADDLVTGFIKFEPGIIFSGRWNFNSNSVEEDNCEICGSEGRIVFNVFDHQKFILEKNGKRQEFSFDRLEHVQQPMISKVVEYFLDKAENPCSANEGTAVMKLMDDFSSEDHIPA